MAKKKKRKSAGKMSRAASTTAKVAISNGSENAVLQSKDSREFNPDYSYVIKDLKRIGTLAAAFFVVLVALSFILG
ncbi:MAG: hypothetical protein MUO76_16485 [Anaerolineaceae bacterium]|jgi:hypothetical protein|nr:hypothetical protein [Anaerolineaceae bacterium]